jgi:hypothetical protein
MPFCTLEKGEQKLNLMKTFLSHYSTYQILRQRCEVLSMAAEEVRNSAELKKVLKDVLKICNYINHGTQDLRAEGTARGFAVESLQTLPSFKMGQVSTMHFLCLTMRDADPNSFEALKRGMQHLRQASREKTNMLQKEVEAFKADLEFAKRQLQVLKEDELAAKERLAGLVEAMEREGIGLKTELEKSLKLGGDVQRYFDVKAHKSQGMPPCEQFFGHLASFMDSLEAAWLEIQRRPDSWKKFMSAGEKMNDITPKPTPRSVCSETDAADSNATHRLGCNADTNMSDENLNILRQLTNSKPNNTRPRRDSLASRKEQIAVRRLHPA